MRYFSAIVLVHLLVLSEVCSTVIKISQGLLRGRERDDFISYEGIPYAKAGIDERFKKAGSPPCWWGIRENQQNMCSLTSPASECLHLDVHMPKIKRGSLPVYAWVRGGSGSYNPGTLVQQGILVVIISHRFGLEGFLCSADERIPGNAGLKDIVLALRWIKDNIVAFRGNASHVVVGGQGFGAAMVEALTLTTMTYENLYKGVILQSGSVLSPWAFQYDARALATAIGKEFDGVDPISNLINNYPKTLTEKASEKKFSYHSFGICVEKNFRKEERFLIAPPYSLLSNDKIEIVDDIPILMGYNSDEANIFLPALRTKSVQNRIHVNPLVLLPLELNITNLKKEQQNRTLVQLLNLYFKKNSTMSLRELLAYHRDAYFLNHVFRSASLHAAASASPVYFYQFSYTPNKVPKNYGPGHADEMAYLFPNKNKSYNGFDLVVQKNVANLWTNFIKYLNPTPDKTMPTWDAMESRRPKMYDINTKIRMRDFPYKKQMNFWDELFLKLYYIDSNQYYGRK